MYKWLIINSKKKKKIMLNNKNLDLIDITDVAVSNIVVLPVFYGNVYMKIKVRPISYNLLLGKLHE